MFLQGGLENAGHLPSFGSNNWASKTLKLDFILLRCPWRYFVKL